MKKTFILKTLIDILYFLHILGLSAILYKLPFGIDNINQGNLNIEEWSILHWNNLLFSIFSYIAFLIGLFYLRKLARFLLSKKHFTDAIIISLKKCGIFFMSSGIIHILLFSILWFAKLCNGKFELSYNTNSMFPLFLIIIGLFFTIQSKTLLLAKGIKEENDLTV